MPHVEGHVDPKEVVTKKVLDSGDIEYTGVIEDPPKDSDKEKKSLEETFEQAQKTHGFKNMAEYKEYVANYNKPTYTTRVWQEHVNTPVNKPNVDITNQPTYTPYELKNAPNVPRHLRTQEFDVYTGAKRYGRGGYEDVGTTAENIEHGVEKPGENLENYQTYNVQGITEEDE